MSIDQARFSYRDPATGRAVIDSTSWDGMSISRNDFHAHYPQTQGQWFDVVHYLVQGPIAECVALTAWFTQGDGYDQLANLAYHYTCPTGRTREVGDLRSGSANKGVLPHRLCGRSHDLR